jgi:hypothetical protein
VPEPEPLSPAEARAARIAELERRTRRRATGVQLPVALVCLAGSVFLLVRQAPAVAYYFASAEPLTLGSEGSYRLEQLRSNVYVQVHGIPVRSALYGLEGKAHFTLLGLQDSPLVVRRPVLATEGWTPGQPAPPPDPRPFGVRGRLLREEDVPAYRDAFPRLKRIAGLRPLEGRLWIVLEGERPGEDRGALLVALLLLGFAGLNAVLAVLGFLALRSRLSSKASGDSSASV